MVKEIHVKLQGGGAGGGRIWTSPPAVTLDGIVSIISTQTSKAVGRKSSLPVVNQKGANGEAPRIGFSASGESFAFAEHNSGRVWVFHVTQNRYVLAQTFPAPVAELVGSPVGENSWFVTDADGVSWVLSASGASGADWGLRRLSGSHSRLSGASTVSSTHVTTVRGDGVVVWAPSTWDQELSVGGVATARLSAAQLLGEGLLVCTGHSGLRLLDPKSLETRVEYKLPAGLPEVGLLRTFSLSRDGALLVAAGSSRMVFCWDAASGDLKGAASLPPSVQAVVGLQWMPSTGPGGTKAPGAQDLLVVLGSDGVLRILLMPGWKPLWRLPGTNSVPPVSFTGFSLHPKGRYALATTVDGGLYLYDLKVAFGAQVNSGRSLGNEMIVHAPGDMLGLGHRVVSGSSARERAHKRANATKKYRGAKERGAAGVRSEQDEPPLALGVNGTYEVNQAKVKRLLRTYGQYPQKHRSVIWAFLLQTPGNHTAAEGLATRGVHPAWVNIGESLPLPSVAVTKRFVKVLSALSWWAPVLGETEWLPRFVYPWVAASLESRRTSWVDVLESIMTVLTVWGSTWAEAFPLPPARLLSAAEVVLEHHHPELAAHFAQWSLGPDAWAWPMMSSAFSETTTRAEWATLWDHVVSNPPQWMIYYVVAHAIYHGPSVFTATSASDLISFFSRRAPGNLGEELELAYRLASSTPHPLVPVMEPFEPLTSPAYPLWGQVPGGVLKSARQRREEALTTESEYLKARESAAALAEQAASLEAREEAWRKGQRMLMRMEEERVEAEAEAIQESRKREATIAAVRREATVRAHSAVEASRETYVDTMRARKASAIARLQQTAAAARVGGVSGAKAVEEEERLKLLEAETAARSHALALAREASEGFEAVEEAARRAIVATEAEDALLAAAWETEDAELSKQMKALEERRALLKVQREAAAAAADVESAVAKADAERELRLQAAVRARRLRHAEEEEMLAREMELDAERRRAELMRKEEARDRKVVLEAGRSWAMEGMADRESRLAAVEKARKEAVAVEAARLEALESAQRARDFEEAVVTEAVKMSKAMATEERHVEALIRGADEAAKVGSRLEERLRAAEEGLSRKVSIVNEVRGMTSEMIAEERAKFEAARIERGEGASGVGEESSRMTGEGTSGAEGGEGSSGDSAFLSRAQESLKASEAEFERLAELQQAQQELQRRRNEFRKMLEDEARRTALEEASLGLNRGSPVHLHHHHYEQELHRQLAYEAQVTGAVRELGGVAGGVSGSVKSTAKSGGELGGRWAGADEAPSPYEAPSPAPAPTVPEPSTEDGGEGDSPESSPGHRLSRIASRSSAAFRTFSSSSEGGESAERTRVEVQDRFVRAQSASSLVTSPIAADEGSDGRRSGGGRPVGTSAVAIEGSGFDGSADDETGRGEGGSSEARSGSGSQEGLDSLDDQEYASLSALEASSSLGAERLTALQSEALKLLEEHDRTRAAQSHILRLPQEGEVSDGDDDN